MTDPSPQALNVVLHQPQIAGNFGAVLRTAANFGAPVHTIAPLGFPLTEKSLRRAQMDYHTPTHRHASWNHYIAGSPDSRRILLTTRATTSLTAFAFAPGDHLVFGNEGSGAPDAVHAACDASIRIPASGRSLNLSVAVAITLFEASRQIGLFS